MIENVILSYPLSIFTVLVYITFGQTWLPPSDILLKLSAPHPQNPQV